MNSMKNNMIKLTALTMVSVLISACDQVNDFVDSDFEAPVAENTASYTQGDADFTTFVSIGDSLTAGYADGALYLTGQQNSYPAILAQQFAKVGGGEFKQPLVKDNLGGLLFDSVSDLDSDGEADFSNRLVLDAATQTPAPITEDTGPTTDVLLQNIISGTLEGPTGSLSGSFNNMGVPGAKSFHLGSVGYGDPSGLATDPATANPYFVRFASATDTSITVDAVSQEPTFFVLWIGNNDVLSYATSGGVGSNRLHSTSLPSEYDSNDITNPDAFADVYDRLISSLTSDENSKGVLVNIPDISTIPYFTTVPHNPVPLDEASAEALNALTAYGGYNAGLAQALAGELISQEEHDKRIITFAAGLANAVVILDEDLTDLTGVSDALTNMRQATADDLLVLTTSSIIGELVDPEDDPLDSASPRWGISAPLTDEHVLIPSEKAAIEAARVAFNESIKTEADANPNLILVDIASVMSGLSSTGFNYGTGFVNSTYATGGTFSLDGVHPTARGYAVVANAIIDAINSGFNANIPKVDPGEYTTIFLK